MWSRVTAMPAVDPPVWALVMKLGLTLRRAAPAIAARPTAVAEAPPGLAAQYSHPEPVVWNSYAPTSQAPSGSSGRGAPRWSVAGHKPLAVGMRSIAGLPHESAIVL